MTRITITRSHKDWFFDRKIVEQFMDKKTASALARSGALVMRIAQNSQKRRKKPSAPGTPPSRHVARGQGLTKIYFFFDRKTKTVVVGPVAFADQTYGDGTTVPQLTEFGGEVEAESNQGKIVSPHTFVVGEFGPIRTLEDPSPRSRRFVRIKLRTGKQVARAQRLHDDYVRFRRNQKGPKARYPKRPFMGPALETAKPKLPELWASAVQSF